MGLYRSAKVPLKQSKYFVREFEVTDGVIHGCPGLEIFNETMSAPEGRTVG